MIAKEGGFNMKKGHEKETKKIKLVSNTPTCDTRYEEYADFLNEKIKEPDVNNIGIIAPYGAGKSSLIKTYKEKYKVKKSVTISLANFSTSKKTEESEENNNSVQDINNGQVERSILEQLLFSTNKADIPASNLSRIRPRRLIFNIFLAIIIACVAASVYLTILERKKRLPASNGKLFYILLALSFLFIIVFFVSIFNNCILKRVVIKDLEAELDCKKGSILNKFIDEIIYYFYATKINIVFIEDLDRFNDTRIFSKLREINFLINNSKLVKQKVTFVYSIKDDIFETDIDRAKFFDYVISIVPLLNPNNAKDMVKNLINENCPDAVLSEDFITDIAIFVPEMRVLNNIVNDYNIYYKVLDFKDKNKDLRKEKLFSLMIYKNIFPKDFAELQFGKGILNEYFLRKNEKIREIIEKNNTRIKELENLISMSSEEPVKNFKILKYIIEGIIIENGRIGYVSAPSIKGIKTFEGVSQLSLEREYGHYYMSLINIEKILGRQLLEIETNIKNKSAEKQDKLNEEIRLIKDKNRKLINISLSEYLNEYNDLEIVDDRVKFLLSNGYISENYLDYITDCGQEILSKGDITFIRNMLVKNVVEYDYKIEKPGIVVAQINENRFSDRYILNFDIFSYLLTKSNKNSEKKEKMLETYLIDGDEIATDFILKYINEGNNIKEVCQKIILKSQKLLNSIIDSRLLTDYQKIAILTELMILPDEKLAEFNKGNCLTNYLSNLRNYADKFSHMSLTSFERILRLFNVKFKILRCDSFEFSFLEPVIENEFYEVNIGNIKYIQIFYDEKGSYEYRYKTMTAVLNFSNEKIKKYFIDNISNVIKELVYSREKIEDDFETIKFILENTSIDKVLKEKYIEKLNIKFDVFSSMDKNLCRTALKFYKIKYEWLNIIKMINDIGLDILDLSDYIFKGTNFLTEQSVDDRDIIVKVCNDIDYRYNIATLKKLSKSFKIKLGVSSIKNDNIAKVLIEENVISTDFIGLQLCSDENKVNSFLAMLIKNKELLKQIRNLYLSRQFIDDLLLASNDDDIILGIIFEKQDYAPSSYELRTKIKNSILRKRFADFSDKMMESLNNEEIAADDRYNLIMLKKYENYHDVITQLEKIDPDTYKLNFEQLEAVIVKKREIKSKTINVLRKMGFVEIEKGEESTTIIRVK